MKKNRRLLLLLLIIITASVFLFSCGMSLPIYFSNVNIDKLSNNGVSYVDVCEIDTEQVDSGPGVVILYAITDESNNLFFNTNISNIRNAWKNNKPPIINNKTEFTYTGDANIGTVVLRILKTSSGSFSGDVEHVDFRDKIVDGNLVDAKLQITDVVNSKNGFVVNGKTYIFDKSVIDMSETKVQYVYLFGAVVAKGYTNYVSDLFYLGKDDGYKYNKH